ncbi:Methyltransferase domain protein [uncultured archaeon]|nr:Methyltransferase domain protein [uncultured archaeon]
MRCPVCDLIFVPGNFHLLPEEEAARYRLHENTLSSEGYVRTFLEKIAIINQHCPYVRSVLDYGCGPEPVLAELLKRNGLECDIYDPYFFPAFPGKRYDLVISIEVFEHFRDIREELNKIRSILGQRGFLAVGTSLHDSVGNFGDWWYASDPTHISFFGKRTFDWIAKTFGFRIIYADDKNFLILQADCCHESYQQ